MLNTKTSILALAMIAVLIVAGNLVIDENDPVSKAQAGQVNDDVSANVVMFSMPRDIATMKAFWKQEADAKALVERAKLKKKARLRARFAKLPGGVERSTLEAIASCESGGDPRIVSSDGSYHGKYQFSVDTWAAVGGKGLPSDASESEQDYRAALLYARSGPGQWPVCG